MTSGALRVLVADDQRAVREGLALLVGLLDGIDVVGMASDGVEAVRLAADLRPDVVVMDLRMPRLDGVAATRQILEQFPETRVLVLTTYADDESLFPALQAGASGYLTKDAGAAEIEQGIRAVSRGETHLDAAVQRRLVEAAIGEAVAGGIGGAAQPPAPAGPPPDELTAREAEVLRLVADGLSNQEIAERLFVSNATVKTHINRVFAKTGVRDRAQAVRYAFEHGLAHRP